MNYLLDTHVAIWAMYEYDKIPPSIRRILLDENCHKFVSMTSFWEIAIKNRIGKLSLPMGIEGISQGMDTFGYGVIPIEYEHIETYNSLPLLHRDPFDGIIIATALVEDMTIITTDENIQKYNVPWVW